MKYKYLDDLHATFESNRKKNLRFAFWSAIAFVALCAMLGLALGAFLRVAADALQ